MGVIKNSVGGMRRENISLTAFRDDVRVFRDAKEKALEEFPNFVKELPANIKDHRPSLPATVTVLPL